MFKLKQAQDYSDVETGSKLDSKMRSRHKSSSMKARKKSFNVPCDHKSKNEMKSLVLYDYL